MHGELFFGVAIGAVVEATPTVAIDLEGIVTLRAAGMMVHELQSRVEDYPTPWSLFEACGDAIINAPIEAIGIFCPFELGKSSPHVEFYGAHVPELR
jgi:hypothetical protein